MVGSRSYSNELTWTPVLHKATTCWDCAALCPGCQRFTVRQLHPVFS